MTPRRYTFIIADRRSGKVLRSTINIRPALITLVVLAALPILIGQGIALKASLDAASVAAKSQTFERENAKFRSLSQSLSGKIEALQAVITDVGARAQLDPSVSSSIEGLPSLTRARAMGMGTVQTTALGEQRELAALSTTEETFVWLHMLLSETNLLRQLQPFGRLEGGFPRLWVDAKIPLPVLRIFTAALILLE